MRAFHSLERFLDDAIAIFVDRQERDLVVELGLEMAGLGLLDRDDLLTEHFLVGRAVECRQDVAALDVCPLGHEGENRRRPSIARAGDVFKLALDGGHSRALKTAGGVQHRNQVGAAYVLEVIALAQRPPIDPGPCTQLVRRNQERRQSDQDDGDARPSKRPCGSEPAPH